MNNNVKRILQVVGSLNRGGAETMIMNIYKGIDKKRVQFDFLVYEITNSSFEKEVKELGGRVILLEKRSFLNYSKKFKKLINEYGPYNAVHSHTNYHSGLVVRAAKKAGIPIRICHAHSSSDIANPSIIHNIYVHMMRKYILRYSTKLLACGKKAGDYFFRSNPYTIVNNPIIIQNFLSVTENSKELLEEEFCVKRDELVIGSIASFREAKNHEFMLKIADALMKRQVKFKMFFAGSGSLMEKIKKEVQDLNLCDSVIFLGLRDDVSSLMHFFDILLMPSLFEGFPVTLVESQAANLSALVSDTISNEVDFGLGLIDFISLDVSIDIWCDKLIEISKKEKKFTPNEVMNKIENKGFSVKKVVEVLYNIYEV